ncbi:MAG: glycosyltransferase family 39 protein [Acidobacteria bacterium]|nr:glycosyltransferase family 39 protein [Acidobacteriota bacterium]
MTAPPPPSRAQSLDPPIDRSQSVFPRRLFVIAVLTIGLMARAATYRSPLFDFHAWRQADTAAIARNFVEERFNPLYPQVDSRGAQPVGYVATGFELHAFMVALLSTIFGFSPALGRLLNVALFPLAALLIAGFVRVRYGEPESLVALFIFALGLPLTMFVDRAFMNESMLCLLSIICLWSAQSFCQRLRTGDFALLVVGFALIAIVKPTYLIVGAPVAGLFVERFGTAGLIRWQLWAVGIVAASAGALWFSHARDLYEATGLSFGFGNKLMASEVLSSPDYPPKLARRILQDILGPVGVLFAPAGLIAALRRGRHAESWGVLAFVGYLVVVAAGNFHHNYYQLPMVPIGTVLTSVGVVAAVRWFNQRYSWQPGSAATAYAAILWVAASSTFVRNVSAHNWYELDHSRMRVCEDLKPLLSESDRVVFVNDPSPDILFCLDRKGWLLNDPRTTVEDVQGLAAAGASVVVLHRSDRSLTGFATAGQQLVETPDFIAYRLRAGR